MITEADTCRKYILPKLYGAGWSDDQINEQKTFTDGRIIVGPRIKRAEQKRADYILKYRPDFPIAIVEAKAAYKQPADGLQQAKEYAVILGLNFAYSTNGHGIIEHNFITGQETELSSFPPPEELWQRIRKHEEIPAEAETHLLTPSYPVSGKPLRYYQTIAINRTVQAIVQGKRRVLLTMATGTGKTLVAFHICWKLWNTRWNRTGEHRKPRILYLADRSILVDEPKDKIFTPFADARWKIQGEAVKGRELYFATYQAIAKDDQRPGLFRDYKPDFFDLIIVDECHRGSARDDSNWREILEYFEPAYQLGMTATPLYEDNRDTYGYFGSPIYTYSLRQGINDGFLAPYRVHRVVTTVDATGWRPGKGQKDRYDREIPDGEYGTKDFEQAISLQARTEAIARHLSDFLKRTDRFSKTIVFCVDQEHAEAMRAALSNLNNDLVKDHYDYVCRVVSDEGDIGRGYLSRFQELEATTPVIVTTSKLLTTGVDIPTCKNVALARVVNSMTEFKQIIGRGTRVRDDYGKYFFTILDYTGSATRLFADSEFDGDPVSLKEEQIDEEGKSIETEIKDSTDEFDTEKAPAIADDSEGAPRKYYVDGGWVEIAAHVVYELDSSGKKLKVVKYTDFTAEKIRSMYPSAAVLRSKWEDAEQRALVLAELESRGITFEQLAEAANQPDADPFDLICHVAFSAPLRTRRERAERLRKEKVDFWDYFQPEAKEILDEILEKYAQFGLAQFEIPDILQVPPISAHGNVLEISKLFGGAEPLRTALADLQRLLYTA